ncbi:hypothetical protein [Geomicrobium sp. JCM 19055]|uniref:hypothetical protein n=1 Tax=Geomicrobium sp. JCM 19055 TaxID=1460649 RepID=UPI00045ED757|nr:hypothetical protein [Geomicrobium sp. JCM 19055]GAK00046.1 hypothetical protein JCM19055_3113 [Geomicrobium sp. JCM 19055]
MAFYNISKHQKNKIWTGKIVVQGVYEIHNADDIFSLHYSGGEEVDVTGDKISTFSGKVARSFRSSTLMQLPNLRSQQTRTFTNSRKRNDNFKKTAFV